MTAKVRSDEVIPGEELKSWSYRVRRDDLVAYANASGDDNPIHQDEDFAKSVGLPDVIAHGMHTMAKVGQFVTEWCGDPGAVESFKSRFTSMVMVPAEGGNTVTVTGVVAEKVDGNRARLELQAATPDGGVAAKAEAIVRLA
jgi:acyl dehydratase